MDGAEGQDGARDDDPQRRLERALQPAHDARRAQQVGEETVTALRSGASLTAPATIPREIFPADGAT